MTNYNDKHATNLYAKFIHLNSLASEISMTELLFALLTGTIAVHVPALLTLGSTSVAPLSSGSGISISVSSSSCASASKCDTMKWPEWIVSRSPRFSFRDVDADEPLAIIQLSRNICCCWCVMLCAISINSSFCFLNSYLHFICLYL